MATTPKVPGMKGLRGVHRPPRLRIARPRSAPVREPGAVQVGADTFDIGTGPWYYKGKKASSAEYRTVKVLEELGWSPDFQVSKFGGRTYPGGQVLDILVTQHNPIVYVDVRGYYHRGAAGEANDARKIMQLRASAPDVRIVVVWDDEAKNKQLLYNKLLREVGARR